MQNELPLIVLKELAGNDIPSLNTMQEAMLPYTGGIINMWWIVWLLTLMVLIRYVLAHGQREYQRDIPDT